MASKMSEDLRSGALVYHRLPKPGKLEIKATKPLGNQRDLALAYSPGVAVACEAIAEDPGQAAELTARTRAWNTTHRHLPSPRHLDILLVMIVGGCILLTVPFWSDPAHYRWANLGIVASSGLSVLALRFMGRSLTVHQRFTRRACPDCGYDLRAIPDEFDPASLGARTGPRHCPECGCLWPLIPPPVTEPPASSPHPESPPR